MPLSSSWPIGIEQIEIDRHTSRLSEADQRTAPPPHPVALPDGWRHLALSRYLENQLWSQTIQKTESIRRRARSRRLQPTPLAATSFERALAGRRNSVSVWGEVVGSMAAGVMAV